MIRISAALAAAVLLFVPPADAQTPPWRLGFGPNAGFAPVDAPLWPGAVHDRAVPTPQAVIGHGFGARISSPDDIRRYFDALAAAAPDRIRLFDYAVSWEGRRLFYAVIGAPEHIARLDEIKAGIARLADPIGTNDLEAARIAGGLPGTVWLAASVHGNEISPADAAMAGAHHLLAAVNDPLTDKIRENTLVFIDPLQNPDGRNRFVGSFNAALGLEPDGSAIAAERNEPWPSGRGNHYLFDMNRDWIALTQPETAGRVAALRAWMPLAFVDAHEMGTNSTYFFAPEADPFNPHLAAGQRAALAQFGRNNARWFDRFGFDYYTREVYDAFYPGYGASWPSYYGAIAMTYEQASARGLEAQRTDGTRFTYRDSVRQHFTAFMATAETVADRRKALYEEFRAFRTSAAAEGRRERVRAFVLPAGAASVKLAGLLARQGVETLRAKGPFTACGKRFSKDAFVVDLGQGAKRLARTLLDANVPLDAEFLAEQERRRARNLPDQIYDVTAWSMPLMFNIDATVCDQSVGGSNFVRHDGALNLEGSLTGPASSVAFLVPWGETPAIRLLARAHRAGLLVRSSDLPFEIGARRYEAGSLIFPAKGNPADLAAQLARFAAETGAAVVGVAESWVDQGPNFGSENVVPMPAPKIAVLWDRPTAPTQAGAARYVIERAFDYPAVAVRTDDLDDRALSSFDVIVMPGGGDYQRALGGGGVDRLKAWVEAGGVLVASSTALRTLTDPDVALLSSKRERAVVEDAPEKPDDEKSARVKGVLLADEKSARNALLPFEDDPDPAAGALVRVRVDRDHWLGAGAAQTVNVLLQGGDIYSPLRLDAGWNVARFEGPDALLASGHLWDETRKQAAHKSFLLAEARGDGFVIGFTQDPVFRGYLDGLHILYANALFRGPAHAAKQR